MVFFRASLTCMFDSSTNRTSSQIHAYTCNSGHSKTMLLQCFVRSRVKVPLKTLRLVCSSCMKICSLHYRAEIQLKFHLYYFYQTALQWIYSSRVQSSPLLFAFSSRKSWIRIEHFNSIEHLNMAFSCKIVVRFLKLLNSSTFNIAVFFERYYHRNLYILYSGIFLKRAITCTSKILENNQWIHHSSVLINTAVNDEKDSHIYHNWKSAATYS